MGVQLDPSCESIKVNTYVSILTLNILIFFLEYIVLLQMS